jgi:hypothetical protein
LIAKTTMKNGKSGNSAIYSFELEQDDVRVLLQIG